MDPKFQRVKNLFLAALEREAAGQRAAFLDEACAGDEALRQQVEALLQKHAAAGSFLEKSAVEAAATTDTGTVLEPGVAAEGARRWLGGCARRCR